MADTSFGFSEKVGALQEFLKNITSLSTWCILLGVGLADKFLGETVQGRGWVFASMLCFFIAILSSLTVQFAVLKLRNEVGYWDDIGRFCCYVALFAFACGFGFIILFAGLKIFG